METLNQDFKAPPFLVQFVDLDSSGAPARTRGSGILLAADWVLTARHVVHEPVMQRGEVVDWNERSPSITAAVRCQGQQREIARILPDDHADIALVRLTDGLDGPYAPLLTGLHQRDRELRDPVILVWFGFRGKASVDAKPTSGKAFSDYHPNWNTDTGELEDIQFEGGAPKGVSGGLLCTRLDDRYVVVGLPSLGGERAFSTRAWAVPRIMELLNQVPELTPEVIDYAAWRRQHQTPVTQPLTPGSSGSQTPMTDYTRALLQAVRQLLEDLASGEPLRNEGLLADAFEGREHDPRKHLQTAGEPALLASQWLSQLQDARCIEGHSPLVCLLQTGFKQRREPRCDYPGGFAAVLRDLDAPCAAIAPIPGAAEPAVRTQTRSPGPARAVPTTLFERQGLLRELLLALPIWLPVSEAIAFCSAALGHDHPALINTAFDGTRHAIAGPLADNVVNRYDLARSPDGSPSVCGITGEIRQRQWHQQTEVARLLIPLEQAYACAGG